MTKARNGKLKKKLSRADQIVEARKYLAKMVNIITVLLVLIIVFGLISKIFEIYQANLPGLEDTIRNNPLGPLTGYEPYWDIYLEKIESIIFSPFTIPFYFLFLAYYYYKYRNILLDLPKFYHQLQNKKKIIIEKFIIPFGLLVGIFIGFIIYIFQIPTLWTTSPSKLFVFFIIPFIFVICTSLFIIFKSGKSIKIKFFISIAIIIFFQF